jgi:hypothetical protein
MGLPGRLCVNEDCSCLHGLAAYAPAVSTDTEAGPMFSFMTYEGSYWIALWEWLTGAHNG